MCPQGGQSGVFRSAKANELKEQELDLAAWKEIVDKIKRYRPVIQLFGGEPLLYSNLVDLVRYIKENKLKCQMVTNGTMLHKYANELVDCGLDTIWVSIDGPEQVHNKIRNGDIFGKVTSGINLINDIKKKQGQKYPKLNLLFTIMDENYDSINDFLDSVEGLGISKITLSHVLFLSEKQYIQHDELMKRQFGAPAKEWSGYVIDVKKLDPLRLSEEIDTVKKRGLSNTYFYPEMKKGMLEKYYANTSFSLNKRCYAPWLTAQFHPDGSVAICSDFKIGNIKGSTFQELWNNEISKKFRKLLSNKKFAVCDRCCMIHRHSLFRE